MKELTMQQSIEAEVLRRAQYFAGQRRLEVDYYRIRMKLAYPLPIKAIPEIQVPVNRLDISYPWPTWMTWALEERIDTLGWAAEWSGDEHYQELVRTDLFALASWPSYRGADAWNELPVGHTQRVLWKALSQWPWIGPDLKQAIRQAFERNILEMLPVHEKTYGSIQSKKDILNASTPETFLRNIPLIGLIGTTLGAQALQHASAPLLNQRVFALVEALLDLRKQGLSEGVAYDGYVLDFVCDWLSSLTKSKREPILTHKHMEDYLEQSYRLAVPGDFFQVAEIGDVEPCEMPFHTSAQAKLQNLRPSPLRAWYLSNLDPTGVRAEGLAQLHASNKSQTPEVPETGALDAHYATVLRGGWQAEDVAVIASNSNSPLGHIHFDAGSIVIGSNGKWIISDPGYQQYLNSSEREFSIGTTAHNAPVLNDQAQSIKQCQRLALESEKGSRLYTSIDLNGCYAQKAKVTSVRREIWLEDNQTIVIADTITPKKDNTINVAYNWHGNPEAAWWIENQMAAINLGKQTLWVTSPSAKIAEGSLTRLRGSRGHLTLQSTCQRADRAPIWWVFSFHENAPKITLLPDSASILIDDRPFKCRSFSMK